MRWMITKAVAEFWSIESKREGGKESGSIFLQDYSFYLFQGFYCLLQP